jgi:hypothetical protein
MFYDAPSSKVRENPSYALSTIFGLVHESPARRDRPTIPSKRHGDRPRAVWEEEDDQAPTD